MSSSTTAVDDDSARLVKQIKNLLATSKKNELTIDDGVAKGDHGDDFARLVEQIKNFLATSKKELIDGVTDGDDFAHLVEQIKKY